MLSCDFLNDPEHWDHFEKCMAWTEGDQLLGGYFHAVLDRTGADMLQISNNRN